MLDFDKLRGLLRRHGADWEAPLVSPREFGIGGRKFDFNARRALMGVINLSTDSGYAESVVRSPATAIERGVSLAAQGADFVDIGAESTLPHARNVPPEEQAALIAPVVRALAQKGVLVSVESYHPAVLEAAGAAGAALFNLTGVREAQEIFKLAKRFGAAVIHCYVQGETARHVSDFSFMEDMSQVAAAYFEERIAAARRAGVTRNIIDPGLGFYYQNLEDGAVRVNHQLSMLIRAFRLRPLGVPVMNVLPHAPEIFGEAHRREAEPLFAVLALMGGSHILRTHEVEAVARVRALLETFRGGTGR